LKGLERTKRSMLPGRHAGQTQRLKDLEAKPKAGGRTWLGLEKREATIAIAKLLRRQ